ncbi:hypothetical protein A0H81_08406 [Grifola frondosa]|uniref:Uncharacterized protein n=1 Tax=Grifola frondosa TaxID=5627 RepID=A0A1C7M582_GRIFR|nr:hypothetical protein A0H81_08406 [Grifola frondosa]
MRLSLMLRRPPCIAYRYVDAKPPTLRGDDELPSKTPKEICASFAFYCYSASHLSDDHQQIYILHWLHGFMAESMAPALELVVGSPPPLYSDVVAMDIRIREFYMPPILHMVSGPSAGNSMNVVQRWAFLDRELALLNLHRGHYVQALTDGFTSKHTHMPSVMAIFRGTRNLIWNLETYYRQEPEFCIRSVMMWSNCFSAAIALSLLISRVPECCLSAHALLEVAKVMRLFLEVKDRSPIAEKALAFNLMAIMIGLFMRWWRRPDARATAAFEPGRLLAGAQACGAGHADGGASAATGMGASGKQTHVEELRVICDHGNDLRAMGRTVQDRITRLRRAVLSS